MDTLSCRQIMLIFVVFLGVGCASVDEGSSRFNRVGQFDSFVGGVSEAQFGGHSVESGWHFGVCGPSLVLDALGDERVRLCIKNEGSAVLVDYPTGSAFLEQGDSVVVYEGTLAHLVKQCESGGRQWVVFRREKSGSGLIKLLMIMSFDDVGISVDQPIVLNAWYSKVVNR